MSTATDIREQVVELAREVAKEKSEPFAAEWDRTCEFPRAAIAEIGRLGFLGMCTPEEYDGMAIDTVTYLMVLEELSAARAAFARSIGIHNAIPTTMLVKHGTPEQKERWLKPMARGEILAGFALSEPEAGSGPAAVQSHAETERAVAQADGARRNPRRLRAVGAGIGLGRGVVAVAGDEGRQGLGAERRQGVGHERRHCRSHDDHGAHR